MFTPGAVPKKEFKWSMGRLKWFYRFLTNKIVAQNQFPRRRRRKNRFLRPRKEITSTMGLSPGYYQKIFAFVCNFCQARWFIWSKSKAKAEFDLLNWVWNWNLFMHVNLVHFVELFIISLSFVEIWVELAFILQFIENLNWIFLSFEHYWVSLDHYWLSFNYY
jgi:hypothetical protein